jgi:hypothetical protein
MDNLQKNSKRLQLAYFTMFLPNEGGVGGVDNFNP